MHVKVIALQYCRYIYPVHSGVMCMDIHPQHSSLAVTGFYDGNH